jgi:hypothetical protein
MMKRFSFYIPAIAGLALMAAALLATQLGFDHNATWGLRRILMLLGGALVLALSALVAYRGSVAAAIRSWNHSRSEGGIQNGGLAYVLDRRLEILTGSSILLVLAVYVFFISSGTWTKWPETSRYYDDLASAFEAGQLNLNIQPSTALLALPDPYEPSVRNQIPAVKTFVDQVWDLAFFHGQFYLYWGPVPAVLILIARLGYPGPIPDQYLVFGFATGLLVFTVLLLGKLRRSLFPKIPGGLFLLSVLTAGLAFPLPVLLGRAAVYEATILGGQFFLIGGLYFAYCAVEKPHTAWPNMILPAVFWALAAGSRTTALVPAAFLTLMAVAWVLGNGGHLKTVLVAAKPTVLIASPLLLSLAIFAWYNWARFGSVLETGVRYTLTFQNLNKFHAEVFSASYALPSLWMYLFTGFGLTNKFPYILIGNGQSPSFLFPGQSSLYHSEQVSGLLLSAPIVLISGISLVYTASMLWAGYHKTHMPSTDQQRRDRLLWISVSLWGTALLAFAAILFVDVVQIRFMAEFVPSLMLVCALGTWQGYQLLESRPLGRTLFVVCVVCLGLMSIGPGLLMAVSADYKQFQLYNRGLMRHLILFFNP